MWKGCSVFPTPLMRQPENRPMSTEAIQTEDAVLLYLEALHKQVPGPIVLLLGQAQQLPLHFSCLDDGTIMKQLFSRVSLDHLPAHRSAKVAAYLTANLDWLTVEWFPSYAPELNPIEYVWSNAKGEPTANSSPDTRADIAHSLLGLRKNLVSGQEVMYGFLEASKLFSKKEERSLT